VTLNPATVVPASFGMSKMSGAGVYKPGERVIAPDDNNNISPAAPVFAYAMPTPRTHGFALQRTAHLGLWGSSDFGAGAGGDVTGFDPQHPCVFAIQTGTTTTGHVGLCAGGGVPFNVFSATSHQRIYECVFMVPVLSTGAQTFQVRLGNVSASFGALTNGAYMEVDSNTNANFQFFTKAGGVTTQVDSGVPLSRAMPRCRSTSRRSTGSSTACSRWASASRRRRWRSRASRSSSAGARRSAACPSASTTCSARHEGRRSLMSPVAESNTDRELRNLRTTVEVLGGHVRLHAEGVSWMRDNFDRRVRELEAERYARELAAAAAPKPPVLPWRLFFCSLASAVLALAGAHFFNV
jgi:hypothetical protein